MLSMRKREMKLSMTLGYGDPNCYTSPISTPPVLLWLMPCIIYFWDWLENTSTFLEFG
jgi:hypothetical protein